MSSPDSTDEQTDSERPEGTQIYKGPKWLIDRIPRFGD